MNKQFIGAVNWYDAGKGFGALTIPGRKPLFAHWRGFSHKPENLSPGDVIIGEIGWDADRQREIAANCRLLATQGDWWPLLELLGQDDLVEVGGSHHSLVELGARQLCLRHDDTQLSKAWTAFYRGKLQPECYVLYTRLVRKIYSLSRSVEEDSAFLNKLMTYFQRHEPASSLFDTWKHKRFKGLEQDDVEIPIDQMYLNATEIGPAELERIAKFSYGPAFCEEMVAAMLDDTEDLNEAQLLEMTQILKLLSEPAKTTWTNRLDSLLTR